jgi:lipoteichoic acid synthase
MRLFSCIPLIFFFLPCRSEKVVQHIRYHCAGASEVFIVWGINNWALPHNSTPRHSWVKDGMVYTPMKPLSGNEFRAEITAEEGNVIDYVFWITKGPFGKETDLWDTNEKPHKDYHTYVAANTSVTVNSTIKPGPSEQVSAIDFAIPILTNSLLISAFTISRLRKYFANGWLNHPLNLIFCSGLVLCLSLWCLRPTVSCVTWELAGEPLNAFSTLAILGFYDSLYVLAITSVFLLAAYVFRRNKSTVKIVVITWIVVAIFSLVFAVLNIRITAMLGRPLNYQWLYYSDFLQSQDAKSAILANVSAEYALKVLAYILSMCLLALTILVLVRRYSQQRIKPMLMAAGFSSVSIFYFVTVPGKLRSDPIPYHLVANPVVAFLASVNPFTLPPPLFTARVADSLYVHSKRGPITSAGVPATHLKNVLVIVLESTPAEYVDVTELKFGVTPHIRRMAENSYVFKNVYSPAPATNLSMFSLLCAHYPYISYQSVTEKFTDIPIPTIASELRSKGYRTGFFNSGDNGYQKAGKFLSNHGFDFLDDCNGNTCSGKKLAFESGGWQHMGGRDDGCTAVQLSDWIAVNRSTPFFAILWTYQTHYPYFDSGHQVPYVKDGTFNRYLNALHHTDSVIDALCQKLKAQQLLDSTLIVLIGDHGEAFGQHGQVTHASAIYEENLHVPCLFYNPLFGKKEYQYPGSIVDLGPTILNLLGRMAPPEWQGESLFAKQADSRAFFFAPWSDELFGYRQKDYKFIYNATTNEYMIYNIEQDPKELTDLASAGGRYDYHVYRLAGWIQSSNKRFINNGIPQSD